MIGSRIAGLGMAVPDRTLTNAELSERLALDESWIEERTGILCRRIAADGDTASSLGIAAAARALSAAGIEGREIDLVICATVTPDWRFPAAACLVQSAIGSRGGAFDLNAGCSGFLYALAQADGTIRSGAARRVVVVGAEVLSRITDYADPKSSVLFGDGAGAAVVERIEGATRLGPFALYSDGSRPELLYVPPATGLIHMQGREVYRAAVAGMAESVGHLLDDAGIEAGDVDLVVGHQANARILDAVGSRLGVAKDRMYSNIARYGNTSAASIPIALAEAHAEGRLHEGDTVVIASFGAGFTWGAGLARWSMAARATAVTDARAAVDA